MEGVCNVDVHTGSNPHEKDGKNEKSVVKLSFTLSGGNDKVKVDTKIEASSTAKQCINTKIDICYENGKSYDTEQKKAIQQSPRKFAQTECCENSATIDECPTEHCAKIYYEKDETPNDSRADLCKKETDYSENHSLEMEKVSYKRKSFCESQIEGVEDYDGNVNDNSNVDDDMTDCEGNNCEFSGTKVQGSNCSLQYSKNIKNIGENDIISDQSGNEILTEGSCVKTSVVEETNILLQNIVNQTHVVEEVNLREEIAVGDIAEEIDVADIKRRNENNNSETIRGETETRIPEKVKPVPKKAGRPKKAKYAAKSVGHSKKLIVEKKTRDENGLALNISKRGRPKKCKTSEKITVEEPIVKKRRTNNSMSIGLDNNEEASIEFLSLGNTKGRKKLTNYSEEIEGESEENSEENYEIEERKSNKTKTTQKNDSVAAKNTRVKLKKLEVSLTKVDITKYNSGATKDFDSTGETHNTKQGKESKMIEKGKSRSKKKSVKAVKVRSKDSAPVLPKYKLDYTFEIKVVGGQKIKTFYCKHCKYKSRFKCGMVRHFSIHSVPLHECQYCDYKTRSFEVFQEHEAKHTKEKPFKCEKCDYRCRYRVDLHHHQAKHMEEKKFRCPHKGCNFITKWKKNISHHVKSHNTTRPFVCHICSMTFKRGQTLKNHLFRHNDDKPKKCDECGFRCKSNYELRMHKLKHSDVRPFPCTFPGCQQRCKVKSDLVKHMRIHTKERNVLCPLCGKGFKSLSDCNKHQKRHSDIRPYGCDICGKFFRFIQGLKQHLRNHQGIKPFQCDVCGHLFSNKSNKDNHMKTHNYDERPYRCPICPYGAKSKDHLLAHIGTMHGHSYAFFCELCKKPFQRYFQLVTHHSRMHTKAEMNKFMSSIGVNMEEAQKEIKVEMVEEGLMTREQIGHMQVTLQQQQNSMDAEEGDEEHVADWGSEHGGTEQSTENVREENTESTLSDKTANSIPGEPQDADNEADDTATARDQFMEDQSEKSSDGKSSEEGSIPLGHVIKQEPREHVNVSATLAIYDGFRLPLFTRGFEFNPDKSGKKPRCWFMEMDNMHEDIKWHQERYFSRIGTYEAKRARVAEMKRIYDETGEMVRIDGRKGARKRKKRFEHLESDDDLEEILAEICDDMPSQQVTEKPIEENEHLGVSDVKKPKGRPPKSKDKKDLAGKAGSPKKRGRPPRPKVAEESQKAIEIRPDDNVDGDGVLDIPNQEMIGEKAGSSKEQAKKKNCKTKLSTQSIVVSAKKKKVVKTETNIKRKGNLKEETHSMKNKKQSKSKTYTSGKQSLTNKGTGVRKQKVSNQTKSKVSTQKKKQAVSKTTEDAKKDSAKSIRKVPPIRLKLQKKNKKRIWKCETSPKKLTKGSTKKTVKIAAKPTAKKGKQKSSSKKSTSRKKSQTNGFVIDWETEEQVRGPSDSNVYVENDFNGTGIKVEISDEVQDNYLGPEYRANDSCVDEESKDNIPKPTASFYCDDVILMKNSWESLKVLKNPPGLSMLGIENSSSRLGTVTNVDEDENSETKELELNDIVMGSSSKVCVYRNPEISDLGDFMKIHSEGLIQDICVAQEINSDIKAEPI